MLYAASLLVATFEAFLCKQSIGSSDVEALRDIDIAKTARQVTHSAIARAIYSIESYSSFIKVARSSNTYYYSFLPSLHSNQREAAQQC